MDLRTEDSKTNFSDAYYYSVSGVFLVSYLLSMYTISYFSNKNELKRDHRKRLFARFLVGVYDSTWTRYVTLSIFFLLVLCYCPGFNNLVVLHFLYFYILNPLVSGATVLTLFFALPPIFISILTKANITRLFNVEIKKPVVPTLVSTAPINSISAATFDDIEDDEDDDDEDNDEEDDPSEKNQISPPHQPLQNYGAVVPQTI